MKTVVLTGPESSGKTFLSQRLQQRFGGLRVEEHVRSFIEREQRDTCLDDVPVIARGQLALEDAARAQRPALLILDTHLLSNMLWSRTLFGDCPPELEQALLQRHYDLHLLLSPLDVEWEDDGQRCQPELADRLTFHRHCEHWLRQNRQRYIPIAGNWAEREARAVAELQQLLASH